MHVALSAVLLFVASLSAVAKDREKVASPPATALPVLRPVRQVEVPVNELLAGPPGSSYVFLTTLNAAAKPTTLLLLEGDTFFVPRLSSALREQVFDLRYANRQVIIEGMLPLDPAARPNRTQIIVLENAPHPTPADEATIKAQVQRRSQVQPCTEAKEQEDLIRRGNRYIGLNRSEAYHCFQTVLTKAPSHIAALEGAASTCDDQKENGCRMRYLSAIVKERPDYYEARIQMANAFRAAGDDARSISELRKVLSEDPPPPVQLQVLEQLIYRANRAARTEDQITYREQWSEIARRYFALYPEKYGRYSRISIVFNDEPLARLLEGHHQWAEAEKLYRRNLEMIAVDSLFQKDVKFDNQLGLARALAAQGKQNDASKICSRWKWSARFVADRGDAFAGYASSPLELAKWELSCGNEQRGLARVQIEAADHPWMYGAYIALRDYYYSKGDVQNALKADEQQEKAHELANSRILSNMR